MPTLAFAGPSENIAPENAAEQAEQNTAVLYSQVRKDLYLSFMVSQGVDADQGAWLKAAANYYANTWSDEDRKQLPAVIDMMDGAIEATQAAAGAPQPISAQVRKLHIPSRHEQTVTVAATRESNPTTKEDQFEKHWKTFRKWLDAAEPVENTDKTLRLPLGVVADIATRMAKRDLEYQDEKKTRGGGHIFDAKDPHSSILRTHAIQGVSTGSEAYDAVFGAIHSLMDRATTDPELGSQPDTIELLKAVAALKESWQKNHLGESFEAEPDMPRPTNPRIAAALGSLASSSL